jgi:hypothetical protein
MKPVKLVWFVAWLAFGSLLVAQDAKVAKEGKDAKDASDTKLALRVAFVGDVEARTKEYVEHLRTCFREVQAHPHGTKPSEFAAADVVVVDWQQQSGMKAIRAAGADRQARAEVCPLGAREAWQTPTVLLGSAGLNLACAWDIKGGHG